MHLLTADEKIYNSQQPALPCAHVCVLASDLGCDFYCMGIWQQGGTCSAETLRRPAAGMLGSADAKAGAAPPRLRATSRAT